MSIALDRAQRAFEQQGLKLTDLRRRVFEEIAGSHHAIGAYDVLNRLANKGNRLAPISVYRAIDALLNAGVIHRLESKNAFFACHSVHAAERDQLILACEQCGRVAEVAGGPVFEEISAAAKKAHFSPGRIVAEVTGLCSDCASSKGSDVGRIR
jgi:Fur family zinc uptake transcriptional regulator